MKEILSKIVKIIGWAAVLLSLASIGLGTDNPKVMFPVYLVLFMLIFAGVYWHVKKHNTREEISPEKIQKIKKVAGVLLVLLGLYMPVATVNKLFPGFLANAFLAILYMLGTAVVVGLGLVAVLIINKFRGVNPAFMGLGLLLLVGISFIPALVMLPLGISYNTLGSAYYAAILVAVLSWWGISLYSQKA